MTTPKRNRRAHSSEIASELNNLLQVIAATSKALENLAPAQSAAAPYFQMLRETIARAADVTAELVSRSTRVPSKIVLHPEFNRRQVAKMTAPVAILGPQPRILLVDDEKMLLILTSEILTDAGFDVVTAQSGFECLDQVCGASADFDLVLLDLNMPLMDGEETFHRLRALRPEQRVMLCTGYVQQERLEHMLGAGLAGFVQKPLGPREYLASVRNALTREACA